MALITDASYVIHTLRLAHLRNGNDALSASIIDLGESASGDGPWIRATGGRDVERWPELQTVHSPTINAQASSSRAPALHHQRSNLQRALSTRKPRTDAPAPPPPAGEGAQLQYKKTIVGAGRALAGGAGYRVSGVRAVDHSAGPASAAGTPTDGRPRLRTSRASESSFARPQVHRPPPIQTSLLADGTVAPTRKRSDSEPMPAPYPGAEPSPLATSFSSRTPGGTTTGDEDGSQHDSAAYSTLGEDNGEEFLEDEMALEEGDAEDAADFGGGRPTLGRPMMNTLLERPGAESLAGGLAGGDEGSEGELDIEREQEDLLDGFREEAKGDRAQGLAGVGDRPEERLPIEGAVVEPKPEPSSAKPALVPQASFSHLKLPLKSQAPIKPSGLSMLLKASSSKALAPFAAYARVLPPPTGSGGTSTPVPTLSLSLYFPHSDAPSKPLKTLIRKVSTVEEVVGLGLFLFGEERRKPALEEGDEPEGSREREIKLSTRGWGLRIVEDDGEVDEDFPALDRDAGVAKFSFLEFAITKATPSQIEQNVAKNPLPVRPAAQTNPSTTSLAPPPSSTLGVAQNSFTDGSFQETSPVLRPSAAPGIPVLLKINVRGTGDTRFTTTISVPSATYLADVVELICKKKRMPDPPKAWVLCLADLSFVLPTDRTVESLMGVTDLCLVKRSWAASHGLKGGGERGGDPNASVFKDFHEPPQPAAVSGFDSPYQKFVVHRKAPIGRHERILAIDGDYIHLMPPEGKAHGFTTSVRTSSYHISSIVNVKQSRKSPHNLKIAVAKDSGTKTYELEAENPRIASDIVTIMKDLMRLYPHTQRQQSGSLLAPLSPNKMRRRPPGV